MFTMSVDSPADVQVVTTAVKRSCSLRGMTWVGEDLIQKQKGQQCALHAVNNLLGSIVAYPACFEAIRKRFCRQYRMVGWSLAGLGKPKRGYGNWSLNIPVEWLQTHSYEVIRVRGARKRRAVFRQGKKHMFLLMVTSPESPQKNHVICVRDGKILDSARGVANLHDLSWNQCVHSLVKVYRIKKL